MPLMGRMLAGVDPHHQQVTEQDPDFHAQASYGNVHFA
jgi:hypothetical protein